MTTQTKLTDTQREVLEHAADQPNGCITWFPDNVKGGARQKVINGLFNKALITSNGGGATAAVNVAENSTYVTTVTATDADSAQARVTAQRLCATVRALALEHLTSPVRHCVTVSVGATCLYPENSAATPGIAQLFEQADAALYQAKKAGRDRAELWMATAQSITLRRS